MEKFARTLRSLIFLCILFSSFAFAQEEKAPSEGVVPAAEVAAELSVRDSVMAARENACKAETDSLRTAIESEHAKSANWEQSYNTVKQDNSVCQQALRVAIDSRTNKDGSVKKEAAMMSASSFLGGVLMGMLLFWLILD